MNAFKRWMSAGLAAVLTASVLTIPGLTAESFADFRIDAANIDVPERVISVERYQSDETNALQPAGTTEYTCKLNRVTEDASFYIQPKSEGVSVVVDYLADLNGDGTYELMDSDSSPMRDTLDQKSILSAVIDSPGITLTNGETYIVSAESLSSRYHQALQHGAQALGLEKVSPQSFPLCRITLRRPGDNQDYERQTYYLELYGKVLIPSDVFPSQWYYSAVEYGLAQGYFSGMEDGRFGPDEPLNRAQLAQVLWTVGGCLEAEGSRFSDTAPDDWFYHAVSWCQQEGLIVGYADGTFLPDNPLTREQLVSILYRYARYAGSSLRATADLSQYDDCDEVSAWARDSLRWAMTNCLLTVSDNSLRPSDTVSRAELASAFYSYDINLGAHSNTW